MFAVNDLVVYPAQGIGQIERIENQVIGGISCKLYTVRVRSNNVTLMVPVDTAVDVGLRMLISRKEALAIWESLLTDPKKNIFTGQNWNRRYRGYSERIKNTDLTVVMEVLRELLLIGRAKELSFGERRLQDQALGLVLGELSEVLDIPQEQLLEDLFACYTPFSPSKEQ